MNIALIGYGRMGHEIESAAVSRGHVIKLIVDKDNISDLNESNIMDIDAAIEFTTPETAFDNVVKCLRMKIPVVCGTTGWLKDYDKAAIICNENCTSFIHSSNFSIGVNILFKLNSELAKQMSHYNDYKPFIEEIHHTKKLDAPSGTAITLAAGITRQHPGYNGWCFENNKTDKKIPIRSIREGMVPGTHTIIWDSEIDAISLKHEAKGRKGLAVGAVAAAEYICSRKGVFTMNEVLGF
jgi:4-hydroxy-tetrahydrodipicolinate reductase